MPKPGFFAGKAERLYHRGLHGYLRGAHDVAFSAMEECLALEPAAPSAHLIAAICAGKVDKPDEVQVVQLETLLASGSAMPDRYQSKFLPAETARLTLQARITEQLWAEVPFTASGAALLLAEHYQQQGRLGEAIGLVQQLHAADPDDVAIRLSLADLLLADDDYHGVVEVAAGVKNDSDVGAALLHHRGAALMALGHHAGALDAFKQALAKPSRDSELLKVIRYDRSLAYEAAGQRGRARQDLERVYAADPGFRDVRERLITLQSDK